MVIMMLLLAAAAILSQSSAVSVEKVLRRVPEDDRPDFIKYYSALGYELDSKKEMVGTDPKFSDLDSVSKFSVDLYTWLVKKRDVRSLQSRMSDNVICFPNGQCVDIGDVGIHP